MSLPTTSGDFVVFPEMFTLQLLSIEDQELSPAESIEALTKYTPRIKESLRDMALRYNINIIGGSHPTRMPRRPRGEPFLHLPARRIGPRAAQDPPDAQRSPTGGTSRVVRPCMPSTPIAAPSAC